MYQWLQHLEMHCIIIYIGCIGHTMLNYSQKYTLLIHGFIVTLYVDVLLGIHVVLRLLVLSRSHWLICNIPLHSQLTTIHSNNIDTTEIAKHFSPILVLSPGSAWRGKNESLVHTYCACVRFCESSLKLYSFMMIFCVMSSHYTYAAVNF